MSSLHHHNTAHPLHSTPTPPPCFAVAIVYYASILRLTTRLGEVQWYQRRPWVQRWTVSKG